MGGGPRGNECSGRWSSERGIRGVDLLRLPSLVTSPTAPDDGKDNQATDSGRKADDERFVPVDPGFDFVAY
jgi:hypothetical protein